MTHQELRSPDTLILTASEIKQCVTVADAFRVTENAFRMHGNRDVSMPPKIALDMAMSGNDNWFHVMPAYVPGSGAAGIKWAGGAAGNPRRGLPYILSILIISDPDTGIPLAIMDGTTVTSLRTGAAAAVAVKWLARREAATVAVIGCGAQGRMCALALAESRPEFEFHLFDASQESAGRLAEELMAAGKPVSSAGTQLNGQLQADVIVTATSSTTPVVSMTAVRPGALLVGIGSHPEFEPQVIRGADKIFVDHLAQNLERGQLSAALSQSVIGPDAICGELGDVVACKQPGRERDDETIAAFLLGIASEDVALGALIYRRAIERQVGQKVRFLS